MDNELTLDQKLTIAKDFWEWTQGQNLESSTAHERELFASRIGMPCFANNLPLTLPCEAARKWVLDGGYAKTVEPKPADLFAKKEVKVVIKCGNIDHGAYLLDDIRDRLNLRLLNGSISNIFNIQSDGHTWITVTIIFTREFDKDIMDNAASYVKGLVAGILLWSGVEVI